MGQLHTEMETLYTQLKEHCKMDKNVDAGVANTAISCFQQFIVTNERVWKALGNTKMAWKGQLSKAKEIAEQCLHDIFTYYVFVDRIDQLLSLLTGEELKVNSANIFKKRTPYDLFEVTSVIEVADSQDVQKMVKERQLRYQRAIEATSMTPRPWKILSEIQRENETLQENAALSQFTEDDITRTKRNNQYLKDDIDKLEKLIAERQRN